MRKIIFIPVICLIAFFSADSIAQKKKPVEKKKNSVSKSVPILPDTPKFDQSNADFVSLRYLFVAGKTAGIEYNVGMRSVIELNGKEVEIKFGIMIAGSYTVDSVLQNGDAMAKLTISRIKIESANSSGVSFDSNQDPSLDNAGMTQMRAVLNVPMAVKVSSIGKIESTDFNILSETIQKAGEAVKQMNLDKTADDMTKSSFVQLPVNPVKKGDEYNAGTIVKDMNGMAELSAQIKFKVYDVSGDQKKVILCPAGDFSLKKTPNSQYKVVLNNGYITGWILFDTAKGNIERSSGVTSIDLSIIQGAQRINMKTTAKVSFRTIESESVPVK